MGGRPGNGARAAATGRAVGADRWARRPAAGRLVPVVRGLAGARVAVPRFLAGARRFEGGRRVVPAAERVPARFFAVPPRLAVDRRVDVRAAACFVLRVTVRFTALRVVVRFAPAPRAAGLRAAVFRVELFRVELFRVVRLAGMCSPWLATEASAADPVTSDEHGGGPIRSRQWLASTISPRRQVP